MNYFEKLGQLSVAVALGALASSRFIQADPSDELKVREITIVDETGNVVGRIGGSEGEATLELHGPKGMLVLSHSSIGLFGISDSKKGEDPPLYLGMGYASSEELVFSMSPLVEDGKSSFLGNPPSVHLSASLSSSSLSLWGSGGSKKITSPTSDE